MPINLERDPLDLEMPVAASAITFLNLRGDVLINRLDCDDIRRSLIGAPA